MRRSTVRDVMTTSVLSVPVDAPFAEVARVLFTGGVRAVPVLDPDCALLGVVSEGDLLATAEREIHCPDSPGRGSGSCAAGTGRTPRTPAGRERRPRAA